MASSMGSSRSPSIRKSLKWFSSGVSAKFMDEKFQCFWFVVEILAQLVKSTEKVHDKCATCRKPLFCETCKTHTKHKPYPKQAIEYLFSKVITGNPGEAFKRCDDVRNRLMHGDDIDSIEKETGREFSEDVDIVGQAAWYAIWNMLKMLLKDTGPHSDLKLFHTNTYPEIIGNHTTRMSYKSPDPDNPRIGEWPEPQVEIERGLIA